MSASNIRSKASLKHWTKRSENERGISKSTRNNIIYFKLLEKATPVWADFTEIQCIYLYSESLRKCGLDVHVHHLVPIRSKYVCGLHVPYNLKVLHSSENYRLSNHTWPNMWIEQYELF